MANYNKTWVVDIETFAPKDKIKSMDLPIDKRLKDEEKIAQTKAKHIALHPVKGGRIACIGMKSHTVVDGEVVTDEICLMLDKDLSIISEQDMLMNFYNLTDGCRIITYNGKKFDLPYITIRGANIGVNSNFKKDSYNSRYNSDNHIDMMERLGMYFNDMVSLDVASNGLLGLRKVDFDVSTICDKLKTDEGREEIKQYCLKHDNSDVNLTYKLALNQGVL